MGHASGCDVEPALAGAKAGWNFAWQTMMSELAPQAKDGSYTRPTYKFNAAIGSLDFPVCLPLVHRDVTSFESRCCTTGNSAEIQVSGRR